jgi:hypothetical protein
MTTPLMPRSAQSSLWRSFGDSAGRGDRQTATVPMAAEMARNAVIPTKTEMTVSEGPLILRFVRTVATAAQIAIVLMVRAVSVRMAPLLRVWDEDHRIPVDRATSESLTVLILGGSHHADHLFLLPRSHRGRAQRRAPESAARFDAGYWRSTCAATVRMASWTGSTRPSSSRRWGLACGPKQGQTSPEQAPGDKGRTMTTGLLYALTVWIRELCR